MRKGKSGGFQWRGLALTGLAFLGMVLVLVFSLSQVDEKSDTQQTQILEDAVLRATLTCYAVEGRYPQSVEYLKKSYGIVYDEDKYIVSMDAFASNILPNIYVLTQGGTLQ